MYTFNDHKHIISLHCGENIINNVLELCVDLHCCPVLHMAQILVNCERPFVYTFEHQRVSK